MNVILDDYNTFKRVYETPILKSRAPGCSSKEAEVGEARSAQVRYPLELTCASFASDV